MDNRGPMDSNRLFLDDKKGRDLVEKLRAEAEHTIDSLILASVVTFLYSAIEESEMPVPEEIIRRMQKLRAEQEQIYCELIRARSTDQYRIVIHK